MPLYKSDCSNRKPKLSAWDCILLPGLALVTMSLLACSSELTTRFLFPDYGLDLRTAL